MNIKHWSRCKRDSIFNIGIGATRIQCNRKDVVLEHVQYTVARGEDAIDLEVNYRIFGPRVKCVTVTDLLERMRSDPVYLEEDGSYNTKVKAYQYTGLSCVQELNAKLTCGQIRPMGVITLFSPDNGPDVNLYLDHWIVVYPDDQWSIYDNETFHDLYDLSADGDDDDEVYE